MATRALISYQKADKSYETIYSHWDGYPTGIGLKLLQHYSDIPKLAALMSRGDISILGEEPQPEPDLPHTFDKPQPNVTVAYKDRGEDCPSTHSNGMDELLDVELNLIEFHYLYHNGSWVYRHAPSTSWEALTALTQDEQQAQPLHTTEIQ